MLSRATKDLQKSVAPEKFSQGKYGNPVLFSFPETTEDPLTKKSKISNHEIYSNGKTEDRNRTANYNLISKCF